MTVKFYQVGGSVRDTLLNRPFTEKDWLVVSSDESEMLKLGYKPVGKHFPVFLHPETKEEYALARQERKVNEGHGGFEFTFNKSVTIEEDLIRRDITINSLAVAEDKLITAENIINLHHGIEDLENRVLRHISDAFAEDPLRLYRVARFMAQLGKYGFSIASETLDLLKEIVIADEPLSSERIWMETQKAMASESPWLYWETLHQCGALESKFPQFCNSYPQRISRLKIACDANLSPIQKITAMHLPKVDTNILEGISKISKLKTIVNFYLKNASDDNVFIKLSPQTSSEQADQWLQTHNAALELLYMKTSAPSELVALALDMVTLLDNSKVARSEEPFESYMTILSSVDKSDISMMQKVSSSYIAWREILPDTFDKVYTELQDNLQLKQYNFMQLLKWRAVMTVLEHNLN